MTQRIKQVDLTQIDEKVFRRRFSGCIVLTQNKKILLQQIVNARPFFLAGKIITFGGRIESGETPMQALVRELKEELGAEVNESDVIYLGVITEVVTKYTELVHLYFWHDKKGTITGCYEDEPRYFDNVKEVLACPKVTADVRWALKECQKRLYTKRQVI